MKRVYLVLIILLAPVVIADQFPNQNQNSGFVGWQVGEDEKIADAVVNLQDKGYDISGPKPADTFFQEKNLTDDKHCLIISMQHDQGLIPFKMAHFGHGVATTLGLRYPRFTVDHGTAFDLAGKDQAHPSSMIHSLELALKTLDVQ